MLVADATVDCVSERPVAITPRVLAHILRDVRACDVVATGPADLTLADLDADATASLAPDVVHALRRAVADHVRQRSHRVSKIKPFTEMSPGIAISDLDLSVRAFNALSRFPDRWLHVATIGDLLDTPGLGASVLVEVLAAYEAAMERLGVAIDGEPIAVTKLEEVEPEPKEEQIPQRVLEMSDSTKPAGPSARSPNSSASAASASVSCFAPMVCRRARSRKQRRCVANSS